jgi:hypothetical protein
VTARQIGIDVAGTSNVQLSGALLSFMNITLAVDPVKPNYITTKFYGSDKQNGIINYYWRPPNTDPNVVPNMAKYPGFYAYGVGNNSNLLQLGEKEDEQNGISCYADLSTAGNGNGNEVFPRSLYYSTIPLPLFVTQNLTTINLLVGGWGDIGAYGQ